MTTLDMFIDCQSERTLRNMEIWFLDDRMIQELAHKTSELMKIVFAISVAKYYFTMMPPANFSPTLSPKIIN